MLATALFKRGTGSNGSPEEKSLQSQCTMCVCLLFRFVVFRQPFSFSIASCRWLLSSQMLCSMELLARPKVRNEAMAKRRCLLHTCPLLKKRPAETERSHTTKLRQGPRGRLSTFNTDVLHIYVIHPSSLNKSLSPSGCKAGPRSCRPVSLWLPSPSSTQKQTLFCVFPDECRTHSHKHQQAVDAGAENKWPVV